MRCEQQKLQGVRRPLLPRWRKPAFHVDAHIYATEAPPAASNYTGTVYIVFVHSGTIVSPRGDIYHPTVFTVTPADKSQVLPVVQEPKTWEPVVVNIGRMYGSRAE